MSSSENVAPRAGAWIETANGVPIPPLSTVAPPHIYIEYNELGLTGDPVDNLI
jgi:hypothetical protein